MSDPYLPPEISDYIVDLLHGESETLRDCCLISKSWVPPARKHLFGEVRIIYPAHLEAWEKAFPDPANSPAYHAHSQVFSCGRLTAAIDMKEGGWVQAFCNVVRLQIFGGTRGSHFRSVLQLLTSS
jgi:hypothetical protein